MSKIKVLVVEDESIVSKDIQQSLERLGYKIAESAATGEKAIELARDNHPDIVLMDIMLKNDMSGIEAAAVIREELRIPVIYLTAYADEATLAKAKISEPYGYIIKPFKEVDLHTSIEMALYKNKKELEVEQERDLLYSLVEGRDSKDYIFVKANSVLVKLKLEDIFYIEALKDYVVINTLEKRYTIHSTMKDIERKLGNEFFVRVHRSFIVRIDKIATIDYPNLFLEKDKKMIPIGGSHKDELLRRINLI
jgi:DNA-binding LytR/AlgR family response regulator